MKNNSSIGYFPFPHGSFFSASLNEFLTQRPAGKGDFFVSDWLDSLSLTLLNRLDERLEMASGSDTCPLDVLTDMIGVCEAALLAEKRSTFRSRKKSVSRKWVKNLQLVAAFVSISRAGYIELCGPLALSSKEDVRFIFTEAGKRLGTELGAFTK